MDDIDWLFWYQAPVQWLSYGAFLSPKPLLLGLWEPRALWGWFLQNSPTLSALGLSVSAAYLSSAHVKLDAKNNLFRHLHQIFHEFFMSQEEAIPCPAELMHLASPPCSVFSLYLLSTWSPDSNTLSSREFVPLPGLLRICHSTPRIYHRKHTYILCKETLVLATNWIKIPPSCNKTQQISFIE